MISVFIRTIIVYFFLLLLLKIMGKRQIGELEISELVSTLLISEIASIPIADPKIPLLYAIIPALFIAFVEIGIASLKNKSERIKHLVEGKSEYLIYKGKLHQDVLVKNRISINEVLSEMRVQGITDIADVYYATLEQNGKLTFVKREDASLVAHPILLDGAVDTEELAMLGLNEEWLEKILKKEGLKSSEVFLLTYSDGKSINIIRKEEK